MNNFENKKLIIFDMDGTILDTIEDITTCVNYILEKYDMPKRSLEEVKFFVGNGLLKTLRRSVPDYVTDSKVEEIYPEFTAYYKNHSNINTKPYEGIVDVISELRKKGYKTAVVSNKRQEAVSSLCEIFFKDIFDLALGDRDGMRVKPNPDMVDYVLKELDVKREESVYIGDSDVDIMTALNSCMDCISVSWGFRNRDFLMEHGAKIIAEKPSDILNML